MIDIFLQMFHTKTDRKRFRRDLKRLFKQHTVCVTRAVSHGENTDTAVVPFAVKKYAVYPIFRKIKSGQFCLKTDFAAETYYFFSHIANNFSENVGSDVRFCIFENIGVCAEPHKRFQHKAASRICYPCYKFAVGKRACSAFAELNV